MDCDEVVAEMSDKECAYVSLKHMYLMLLKAQEMVLDINPQHHKKEIMNYLSSIEHDLLMMNDKDTCIDADLFR